MAEPVDRLELVSDEEELARANRSISSHWSRFVSWNSSTMIELKRRRSRSARIRRGEQVAGAELEILEVERGLRVLRALVRAVEQLEQLLQQGPVAYRRDVERGLLQRRRRL